SLDLCRATAAAWPEARAGHRAGAGYRRGSHRTSDGELTANRESLTIRAVYRIICETSCLRPGHHCQLKPEGSPGLAGLSESLRWFLVRERQVDRVIAHVLRPVRNVMREAAPIVREKRARGFFESGQVPGDSGHEPVCRFLRGALAVRISIGFAGFIDKPPQCDRSAAGLHIQPIPVPRQESHLFPDHAQAWSAASAGLGCWRLGRFVAEIKVGLRACRVVKDKDLALWLLSQQFHEVADCPRSDSVEFAKSRIRHSLNIPG